ncbi:hypothetical protein CR513_24895, partial [Mucuna pruriens]
MSFVIRLHCIAFGASFTDPLLVIAVLPSEVLLYPNKITQGMTWVMDTQTLSSSPLVSPSSIASMAPCASSYASEGSGPSGTPGCRSHTHNDLIPTKSSARGTPLLHPDLLPFSVQGKGSEVGTDDGDKLLANMVLYGKCFDDV